MPSELHSGVSDIYPILLVWYGFNKYNLIGLRSNILRLQFENNASPGQTLFASAVSGGLAGGGVNFAISKFRAAYLPIKFVGFA